MLMLYNNNFFYVSSNDLWRTWTQTRLNEEEKKINWEFMRSDRKSHMYLHHIQFKMPIKNRPQCGFALRWKQNEMLKRNWSFNCENWISKETAYLKTTQIIESKWLYTVSVVMRYFLNLFLTRPIKIANVFGTHFNRHNVTIICHHCA